MSEPKVPLDRKSDAPRSQSYSHWYNPTLQIEDKPLPAARRGKTRERVRRRQQVTQDTRSFPSAHWSWWTWGVIVAAIVGVIGVSGVISLATLSATRGQTGLPTQVPVAGGNDPGAVPTQNFNIQAANVTQRYTILVMGMDKRPDDTSRTANTDTIMVISVDPGRKSIGILSIPRDLFVPLPGQPQMQRINALYTIGELDKPGGGPKLAMQAIQYNFGIPVNNYVIVSFQVLIDLVDAIGGIDIDVPSAISDPEYPDMNYGFDPLYIPAGKTHMDGKLALKYARTRHQDNDYGRAGRQQQVLLAIRQKLLSGDQLTKLIPQAGTMWGKLNGAVFTDLTLERILSMGWYVKDIPADKILRGTVENEFLQTVQTDGESNVTINRAEIARLMVSVFGPDYSH